VGQGIAAHLSVARNDEMPHDPERSNHKKRNVPDKSGNYKNVERSEVVLSGWLYSYLADELFHFTAVVAEIKHAFASDGSLKIETDQGFVKRNHAYVPVGTDYIG
jgi:hypothetical protein